MKEWLNQVTVQVLADKLSIFFFKKKKKFNSVHSESCQNLQKTPHRGLCELCWGEEFDTGGRGL